MATTAFPTRKRCKTCRGGLGLKHDDPVLFGLYCSPRCAGIPTPPTKPADAPRECKTQRDGGAWSFKRRYRCEEEIPGKLRADPAASWYACQSCGHLHIGHSRIDLREQARVLRDPAELGDLLVKLRGKATRTMVAKAAGIRPIRLKELEEGAERVDLVALFKVMALYRVRPAVMMRP